MDGKEPKRSFDSLTPRLGVLIAICCAPLLLIFAHLGALGRGMAAAISVCIIVAVVRYFWDLKNHVWFWAAIALIVGIHTALVMLIAWPDRDYRGVQLLPLGLLDFAITYGIIRLSEHTIGKSS